MDREVVDREVVDRGVVDREVVDRGVVDRGVVYRGVGYRSMWSIPIIFPPELCDHTTQRHTPRIDRGISVASTSGIHGRIAVTSETSHN